MASIEELKADVLEKINRLTDQHGYATYHEREASDSLLQAALMAFQAYSEAVEDVRHG